MASQFEAIASGSVKTVAGNGHSLTFKTAGEGGATPEDMVGVWGFLIEKYDQAVTELGAAYVFTTDNAGDFTAEIGNAIVERMVTYIRPITGTISNFMYMSK